MNNELISIIVPIYNVQVYLDECIDKCVNQTYPDIEIILVDDGSTDLSAEKADYWAAKDSRIKVYHKANGGSADAKNFGLMQAKGQYICFVDSDDYIETNFIEKLYKCMKESDSDVAGCRFYRNKGNEYVFPEDNSKYDFICNPE